MKRRKKSRPGRNPTDGYINVRHPSRRFNKSESSVDQRVQRVNYKFIVIAMMTLEKVLAKPIVGGPIMLQATRVSSALIWKTNGNHADLIEAQHLAKTVYSQAKAYTFDSSYTEEAALEAAKARITNVL